MIFIAKDNFHLHDYVEKLEILLLGPNRLQNICKFSLGFFSAKFDICYRLIE